MGMIFHKMFACKICLSASSRVCIFILNSIRHFLTSYPFFNFIRIWIIVVRRHLIGSLSPNRELSHSLMDAITTFVSRCASTLKFDFLWDKTAKTTSSNVRVTIVYFVIYRESYNFIFSFKIDIYSFIWKLKYTMPPSWCVFRSKNYVKRPSCHITWWYSYYISFRWVKIKCFNVLFVWSVDNNSYVRNYCKFHLSLMTGTCTGWCLLSYKLVVSGLFVKEWSHVYWDQRIYTLLMNQAFDMVTNISKVDNNICKKHKTFIHIFELLTQCSWINL